MAHILKTPLHSPQREAPANSSSPFVPHLHTFALYSSYTDEVLPLSPSASSRQPSPAKSRACSRSSFSQFSHLSPDNSNSSEIDDILTFIQTDVQSNDDFVIKKDVPKLPRLPVLSEPFTPRKVQKWATEISNDNDAQVPKTPPRTPFRVLERPPTPLSPLSNGFIQSAPPILSAVTQQAPLTPIGRADSLPSHSLQPLNKSKAPSVKRPKFWIEISPFSLDVPKNVASRVIPIQDRRRTRSQSRSEIHTTNKASKRRKIAAAPTHRKTRSSSLKLASNKQPQVTGVPVQRYRTRSFSVDQQGTTSGATTILKTRILDARHETRSPRTPVVKKPDHIKERGRSSLPGDGRPSSCGVAQNKTPRRARSLSRGTIERFKCVEIPTYTRTGTRARSLSCSTIERFDCVEIPPYAFKQRVNKKLTENAEDWEYEPIGDQVVPLTPPSPLTKTNFFLLV